MILRTTRRAFAAGAELPAAVLAVLALLAAAAPLAAAELTITVTNVHNDRGNVEISVYDSADEWPDHPKDSNHQVQPAKRGEIVFKFDLPPGTYAAAGYHDENKDGKFNKDFMGLPREGYMLSNNKRPDFSAPDFEDVAFTLEPAGTAITMRMNYPGER